MSGYKIASNIVQNTKNNYYEGLGGRNIKSLAEIIQIHREYIADNNNMLSFKLTSPCKIKPVKKKTLQETTEINYA